jgi:TP901 family phage tail tape measure protein
MEPLELEALFVRIYARYDQFTRAVEEVQTGINTLLRGFERLEGAAGQVAAAVSLVSDAMGALAANIPAAAVAQASVAMSGLAATVEAISASSFGTSIGRIADGLERLARVNVANVSEGIAAIGKAIEDSKLYSASVTAAIANISSLATSLGSLTGIRSGISGIATPIADAISSISDAVTNSKLNLVRVTRTAENLNTLAPALEAVANLPVATLTVAARDIAASLGTIDTALRTAKLGYKSVANATENLKGLSEVVAGLTDASRLTNFADSIKTNIPDIGTAVNNAKMGLVGFGNAVGNLKRLGEAVGVVSGVDLSGLNGFRAALQAMVGSGADSVTSIMRGAGLHLAKFKPVLDAWDTLARAVARLSASEVATAGPRLRRLAEGVTDFLTMLNTNVIGSTTFSVSAITTMLDSLAQAISGLTSSKLAKVPAQLGNIATAVDQFMTALAAPALTSLAGPAIANLDALGDSLAKLAGVSLTGLRNKIAMIGSQLAPALTALGNTNFGHTITQLNGLTRWLQMFSGLSGTVNFSQITKLSNSLVRLSSGLRAMGSTPPLPPPSGIDSWLKIFAGVDDSTIARMFRISRALAGIASFMNQAAMVKVSSLGATTTLIRSWVASLASINPTAILAVTRIGRAMSGMAQLIAAAGTAGVRLPGITSNINNITNAATAAGGSLGWLGFRFTDLARSARAAGVAVSYFRLSLGGLAGFGLFAFAKFDDLLTRALAHMRDWAGESRKALSEGTLKLSLGTTTGTPDLTKGLDMLVSSGQSAGMALKSLEIAERFAAASGMEMADATRRLIDLQTTLGMNSENVAEHYANMTKLSDQFVGMAPMVGSTVSQLTESFGDHYVAAIQQANLSLEQAIALQGIYSLRGIRGANASDRAARALYELSIQSEKNYLRWRALGVEVFDATGKMRAVPDVLASLEERLGGMTHMQQVATMSLMGFEHRAISAILPLVGMSDAYKKLYGETANVEEITRKMAEMLRADMMGQLRILWNHVSGVARIIGDRLAPILAVMNDGLQAALGWFLKLNPAFQNLIIITGAFVALVGPAFRVLSFAVGTLLLPVRLLAMTFVALGNVARIALIQIPRLVLAGVSATVSGVGKLLSTLVSFATQLPSLFYAPFRAVVFAIEGLGHGLIAVFTGLAHVVNGILFVFRALAQASINFGLSILNAFVALIPTIISLLAWTLLIPFALAGIVTTVLTVGAAFGAVAAAANHLWNQMKGRALEFTHQLADGIQRTSDGMLAMWDRAKPHMLEFFVSIGERLGVVAGFFWHFGENVLVIWDWLRSNWRELMDDLVKAGIVFVDNTIHNIGRLIEYVGTVGASTWKGFWGAFKEMGVAVLFWFRTELPHMIEDLFTIFKSFANALVSNMTVVGIAMFKAMMIGLTQRSPEETKALIEKFKEAADNPANSYLFRQSAKARLSELEKELGATRTSHTEILNEMNRGLVAPFKELKPTDFKTQGLSYLERFLNIGWENAVPKFAKMLEEMAAASTKLHGPEGLKELMEGFNPSNIYDALFGKLNTTLPSDAGDKLAEFLKKYFKPYSEGGEFGAMPGKGSPGFQFRQISLQRYMLGGPAAEKLDYQQLIVTQEIRNILINIQRGLEISRNKNESPYAEQKLISEP